MLRDTRLAPAVRGLLRIGPEGREPPATTRQRPDWSR